MEFLEGPSVHATRMSKVFGIVWKFLHPFNDEGKWNIFFVLVAITQGNFLIGIGSYVVAGLTKLTPVELVENAGYFRKKLSMPLVVYVLTFKFEVQVLRHFGYLVILVLLRKRIRSAIDKICQERLELRSTDDDWSLSIDYMKKEFKISVVSSVIAIFNFNLLAFSPFLVDNINQYQLPYNFYFVYLPFGAFMTPEWFLQFIQIAVMVNFAGAIFFFYYGYVLLLMNFSCFEIDALTLQVKKMFHKELNENLIKDQVKKTVLRSYRVMDWMNEARKLLRFSFLIDFSMSALILCTFLFTLSSDILESIPMFVFIFVAIVSLSVLCWMGNRVTVCIENLTAAIYEVEWYTQKAENQKDLLKILIMAQRLKSFNGIFYTVDWQTLLTILQFTYSLLALLRTTN